MDPIPLPILWDVREYLRQKRDQLTELNEVKKTQVKIQFSKNNSLPSVVTATAILSPLNQTQEKNMTTKQLKNFVNKDLSPMPKPSKVKVAELTSVESWMEKKTTTYPTYQHSNL